MLHYALAFQIYGLARRSLWFTTVLFFNTIQAQALPKNTKGELYYSNQEGLDVSRNKVQSRPKIGNELYVYCM